MTTPVAYDPQPTAVVKGSVVEPTAYAGPQPSSVYGVAQVLKELVHGVPHAFTNENALLRAISAIDQWVKVNVKASEMKALSDGTERAMIEDVSKRVAPQGAGYVIPTTAPTIDYEKLAEAMVRAQMRIAAEHAVQSAPAPAQNTGEDVTQ